MIRLDELAVLARTDIRWAIQDDKWQAFRISLKGLPTKTKLEKLDGWLKQQKHSRKALVQVVNYINALKRGGLL